jgi:hypothetical protein
MAWLLKIETDSILIKEKRKHLSKTLDSLAKLMKRKRLMFGSRESSHRSIYRYTKFIRYLISLPLFGGFQRRNRRVTEGMLKP